KWKEYSRLARVWADRLLESGVGLVANPLGRAGAPALSTVPGALPGGSYFAQVSWLDAWGNEGAASEAAAMVTQDLTQLVVTPPAAPQNACGWNVYAGATAEAMARQNDETLELGTIWTMPAEGPRAGRAASQGQGPDLYVTIQRARRRG
ncbi:MAG: hypothetical protein HY822_19360, partial [Acidobacteria bacterium]|nr:hypothetical protein [Acidobacteriota bacterium]